MLSKRLVTGSLGTKLPQRIDKRLGPTVLPHEFGLIAVESHGVQLQKVIIIAV